MSASLISPSSFGLFGMQVQHQTSTHAGNILSSYGNPCKLDPVQVYATCMCLPKRKGKWALPNKNLAKALDDYLAKGDSLEDPFSKQTLRNYQPCVSTPKTPEQHKACVNQQNTVRHKFCPILYPATLEEHPINNNDLDRVRLLNTCCITQKVRC